MKKYKKTKVCFVLPSLRAGGAERVMSYIAQNINKNEFEPLMIIFGFKKDVAYDIDNVEIVFLNKSSVRKGFFKIINVLMKVKPDIVIGSIGHVNSLLSLISVFFKKTKFIGREANVISVRKKMNSKNKGSLFSLIHRRSFTKLDIIICQSNDMLNDIIKSFPNINTSKLVVINNPITNGFTLKKINLNNNRKIKYITVGALHERKGHKRILNLLSKVDHDYEYTIIGSGPKEHEIMDQIKTLNLSDKITHIPYTKEVPKFLKENDVFLNGSYVEGFPNVMIESCASGTPVMTFNAPGGINEIILNGVNGYIVNDEKEYIDYLNKNNKKALFDSAKVNESVTSRYSKDIIIKKYETLFKNLTEDIKPL